MLNALRLGQPTPRTVAAPAPTAPAPKKKAKKSPLGEDSLTLSKAPPANATATEARQKADAMWVKSYFTPGTVVGFRQIERNFNEIKPGSNIYWMERDAYAQSKANAKLEAEALSKLTPDQQAAFQRLAQPFSKDDNEGNARLALQMLLLEGKLTDARLATDGTDLLTQFDRLLTAPLHDQIDRTRLMAHLLRETAEPTALNQQNRGTCTVTAIAIMTVLERPAEYVRIVAGLASPEGKVTLKNGETLERLAGTETDDGTPRSLPMRLWNPAFMNFSSASKQYSNAEDKFPDGSKGLTQSRYALALKALSNEEPVLLDPDRTSKEDVLAQMQTALTAGKPTLATLKWGDTDASGVEHGFHELLVTRITSDRVYYDNPWGSEESISLDDFKSRLEDATLGSIGPVAPVSPVAPQPAETPLPAPVEGSAPAPAPVDVKPAQ